MVYPQFRVLCCSQNIIFRNNTVTGTALGGAVAVDGNGVLMLQNVSFIDNHSGNNGIFL